MDSFEVVMSQKKTTDGTVVFADSENPWLRSLYINKFAFKGNGGAPKRVKVSVEEVKD